VAYCYDVFPGKVRERIAASPGVDFLKRCCRRSKPNEVAQKNKAIKLTLTVTNDFRMLRSQRTETNLRDEFALPIEFALNRPMSRVGALDLAVDRGLRIDQDARVEHALRIQFALGCA
jgi:hypothetical protein